MNSAKQIFAVLGLILITTACGKSDSAVLPLGQNTGPAYPYNPGGYYNGGGCAPFTMWQNFHLYTLAGFFGLGSDNQSFDFAYVCPNAVVTFKGDSDEDLNVRNQYGQDFDFTRAELDAGKTVTFTQGGILNMSCDNCHDLSVHWDYITVHY